jgi:hypothetical protein
MMTWHSGGNEWQSTALPGTTGGGTTDKAIN